MENIALDVMLNLYVIPSFIDFEYFPKYLYKNTFSDEEADFYLSKSIEPLKKDYDMILIDVPPMSIEVTKTAVISSDYVLISLQTQERSLTGAENYVKQLLILQQEYNLDLEVTGVLPVLQRNKGAYFDSCPYWNTQRPILKQQHLLKGAAVFIPCYFFVLHCSYTFFLS